MIELLLAICVTTAPPGVDYATWSCGTPESAMSDYAAWPRNCMALAVHVDPSGLKGMSADGFRQAALHSLAQCSKPSGLSVRLADSKAASQIEIKGERMRAGTLAYCYFPSGSCGDRLACRFNNSVDWSADLFADTLTHELGHGFGLPHTNERRDIMFPSMVQGRALDAAFGPHYSIPALVARYGDPEDAGPPPLPPTPPTPPETPGSGFNWQVVLQWVIWIITTLAASYAARVTGFSAGADSGKVS